MQPPEHARARISDIEHARAPGIEIDRAARRPLPFARPALRARLRHHGLARMFAIAQPAHGKAVAKGALRGAHEFGCGNRRSRRHRIALRMKPALDLVVESERRTREPQQHERDEQPRSQPQVHIQPKPPQPRQYRHWLPLA
jgi:hypothetical protein